MLIQIGATEKLIDCFEAHTPEEHAQGLLGASHLEPGTGLLFFHEEEAPRSHWMPPQMRFPIDMVFIRANGKIIEIFENCQPGELDPSGRPMRFAAPAKWVLELPAGDCSRLGMLIGNQINFDDEEEGSLV